MMGEKISSIEKEENLSRNYDNEIREILKGGVDSLGGKYNNLIRSISLDGKTMVTGMMEEVKSYGGKIDEKAYERYKYLEELIRVESVKAGIKEEDSEIIRRFWENDPSLELNEELLAFFKSLVPKIEIVWTNLLNKEFEGVKYSENDLRQ